MSLFVVSVCACVLVMNIMVYIFVIWSILVILYFFAIFITFFFLHTFRIRCIVIIALILILIFLMTISVVLSLIVTLIIILLKLKILIKDFVVMSLVVIRANSMRLRVMGKILQILYIHILFCVILRFLYNVWSVRRILNMSELLLFFLFNLFAVCGWVFSGFELIIFLGSVVVQILSVLADVFNFLNTFLMSFLQFQLLGWSLNLIIGLLHKNIVLAFFIIFYHIRLFLHGLLSQFLVTFSSRSLALLDIIDIITTLAKK